MLTPKNPSVRKSASARQSLWIETRIRGGSSDSEVNELTVKPTGEPSGRSAVVMVTPVAKRLLAILYSWPILPLVLADEALFMSTSLQEIWKCGHAALEVGAIAFGKTCGDRLAPAELRQNAIHKEHLDLPGVGELDSPSGFAIE